MGRQFQPLQNQKLADKLIHIGFKIDGQFSETHCLQKLP